MAKNATTHVEIERKYDVPGSLPLPPLTAVDGVATVSEPATFDLEAVYVDTADLALAQARTTLRRRRGGPDEGWHLKLPGVDGARQEVHAPLTHDLEPPAELLRHVRVHARDRALEASVTLQTRRTVHHLLGADGQVLAEVADDAVSATPHDRPDQVELWREWEVELVDGGRKVLDATEAVLLAAGAKPASGPSKYARALGDRLPPQRAPKRAVPDRRSTAAVVVLATIAGSVETLTGLDPAVRADEPDAVHRMRVATRRLRAALTSFRPFLDRSVTEPLREELHWLAALLGAVRDAEVLRERLLAAVHAEPAELVLGPVVRRIEVDLTADHRAAHDALVEGLDSARYFRLLDGLDALCRRPPWQNRAMRPARKVLPPRLRRFWKRLESEARAADRITDERLRAERLHEVRKAAKRLRYAVEATQPVFGRPAQRLVSRLQDLQEVLGEQHDAIVTAERLRALAAAAYGEGEQGFTYGVLAAREQDRARAAAAAYEQVWADFARRRPQRWLED